MKLTKRIRQTLAIAAVATTLFSAVPAFGIDYSGHWAEEAIENWKDKGVVEGYADGSFKPEQSIRRAELAKILVKALGLTSTEGAKVFKDVPAGSWYAKEISLVSAAGLMKGDDENFRPNDMATREETAYVLAAACQIVGKGDQSFVDQGDISEWAKEAVEALVAGGYMKGYPDGSFKPQDPLTRAEIVKLLDNIVEQLGLRLESILKEVVIGTKDSEEIFKIPVESREIIVDVTQPSMNINGQVLAPNKVINTAKMTTEAKNIVLSMMPGNGDDISLKPTSTYNVKEFLTIMKSKQGYLNNVIKQAHKRELLTDEQYTQIQAWVDGMYQTLDANAGQTEVMVSSLRYYILKNKADMLAFGIDRINQEYGFLLRFLGATITQDGGTVTVTFPITVTAPKKLPQTLTMAVKG